MAHYHCTIKAGPRGTGADHAQYIERGGRFKAEKYGQIGESERGNLPDWAQGSAARFFAVADERERANGTSYREFELALPRELNDRQRGELVRAFVREQIGERHAYVWAIHEPRDHNPHVHIMFSERTRDGIERGEEQYFKRANTQHPERGGCLKSDRFSGGLTRAEREAAVEALRDRWERAQNLALERAGSLVRVDHRSLAAQGIERGAGQHRGPAVSGIEARGEIAQVTARRAAQRQERREALQPERLGLVADIREVTREEVAVQRAAVRERRELAREVTGEDRELVLSAVEADRREQIERVGAQAERRIERRGGLSGRLGEKLLEQARSLRERIGQQLHRVREWVLERFPQLNPERARAPVALDLKAERARGRAASDRWRVELHRAQAAQKQAALERREREGVIRDFKDLAASRAMQRTGYGDRSEEWRATPKGLREAIDRFNAQPKKAQERALERMAQEPKGVRELQQWIAERRQRVNELDRGMGL
jgi:hypothetical protein